MEVRGQLSRVGPRLNTDLLPRGSLPFLAAEPFLWALARLRFYTVPHSPNQTEGLFCEAASSQPPPSRGTRCSSLCSLREEKPAGLGHSALITWVGAPHSGWTSGPAQKGAGIHFAQPPSLSLPACLQVCGQFVQDTHLSLWFPISVCPQRSGSESAWGPWHLRRQ